MAPPGTVFSLSLQMGISGCLLNIWLTLVLLSRSNATTRQITLGRSRFHGVVASYSSTTALITSTAYSTYWVSFTAGLIRVGLGNSVGINTVISYKDSNPIAVNNVQYAADYNVINFVRTCQCEPQSPWCSLTQQIPLQSATKSANT